MIVMPTPSPHPSRVVMDRLSLASCSGHDRWPWLQSEPPLSDVHAHLSAALALARETVGRCDQAPALVVEICNGCIGGMLMANDFWRGAGDPIAIHPGDGSVPLPGEAVATPWRDVLTTRERQVLCLIAAGRSNREMAEILFISPRTVERHLPKLYLKLDVHGKAEATASAQCHHLD